MYLPSPRVSFEYFPPKSIPAERALMTAAHALRRFQPEFQTMTFGAGGSAIEEGLDWPQRLQGLNDIPTAAHIALCRFPTKAELSAQLDTLVEQGIKHLVVLRGDAHGGLCGFEDLPQGIAWLKQNYTFTMSVACYPETHPMADSPSADMDVLLAKQAAGADRAITQFFFDNEHFYSFRDRAERKGFYKEIVPGILPISNFSRVTEFAQNCGSNVPQRIVDAFEACGDDKEKQTDLAREIVCKQVEDLANNGVDAIHIYTLNRVDLAADAARAFQKTDDRGSSNGPTLALVG